MSAQVTAVRAVAELAVAGQEAGHWQHAGAVELAGARGLIGWPPRTGVIFSCALDARFRIEWLQARPH